MKKLAVFFPGIGYSVDKPLMHYSRRLAVEAGYEIRLLPYSGFPKKVRGDREKMQECFRIAAAQSREILSDLDLSDYDEILFVGKSIGTAVAAQLAAESAVPERIRMLLYTPLEDTFTFPVRDALVFAGNADPWVSEGRIPALCTDRNIPCHVIANANHSLETENILSDIRNMKHIMKHSRDFIRHSSDE